MEFDQSSKQDVFCTTPNDYLQDFHHLDLTFFFTGEESLTLNTNYDQNFIIETIKGYDLLVDPLTNHDDNFSSMGQNFKSFDQNGDSSGNTLIGGRKNRKNLSSSMKNSKISQRSMEY